MFPKNQIQMKRAMSNILSHKWMIINGEFYLANKKQIINR